MQQQSQSWLNKNILGFSIASFFSDLGHEMTTAVLPSLLITLVGPLAAPSALGLITGLSDAIASCLKPFSGMLSDLLPRRKPLIVAGYAMTGIFVGIIGFATSTLQILLYRTLAWTGRGLREPARDAFITESVKPQFYGRAFGFHRAMDTCGAILGPLVVFLLIPTVSITTIFILSFIPGACAVLAIAWLTHEHKHHVGSLFSWQTIVNQFTGLPTPFIIFVIIMFIFGCGNFNKTLLILFAQTSLQQSTLVTLSLATLLYALFNCSRALSEYLLGWLSDYVNRPLLLAFFGFGLFGSISLCMMFTLTSTPLLALLFIANGISTAAVTALEKAYAADLLPANVRGTGFGLLQCMDGIGDFIASFIVGMVWSSSSRMYGFGYAALLSFVAMVLLIMHAYHYRQHTI